MPGNRGCRVTSLGITAALCLVVPGPAAGRAAQVDTLQSGTAPADTSAREGTAPVGVIARDVPDSMRVGEGVPLALFDTKVTAYPYAYYTPETEFAIGAGGIVTFYTSKTTGLRPSKVVLGGYYSTKGQYKINLSPDLYFDQNRLLTEVDLDYGFYVDRFYGIGNTTADIDSANYEIRGWGVRMEVQLPPLWSLFHQTRGGLSYELKHREVVDTRGNPNLEVDPPPRGIEGGLTSAPGWVWAWDTRDHVFTPQSGVYTRLSGAYYMQALGSDYDFNRYKLDMRLYRGFREKNVLAIQLLAHLTGGTPPFYELPALGGSQMLRGYYEGRYRDRIYLAGQVELRRHLFWRIGGVAFVGLGDVGNVFTDIRIRTAQVSGGLGARLLFNEAEKVNLRVDFGVGKNTTGVYFGLEESF